MGLPAGISGPKRQALKIMAFMAEKHSAKALRQQQY